ncbi:MAG: hypothetical protein IJ343_09675 [Clostridia bacterium]|nr:hypothetical protein [Clostridia bacterium]
MTKEAGLTRVERWGWRGLIVLYVPLMLLGPLLGMGGEAYIGVPDPAVQALSDAAYWLSVSLLPVIPASVAAAVVLRRRGHGRAAWCVLLLPLIVLAGVIVLYTAADGLRGL